MSVINQVLKDLDTREPLQDKALNVNASAIPSQSTYQTDWLRVVIWTVISFLLLALVVNSVFFEKQIPETMTFEPAKAALTAPKETLLAQPLEAKPAANAESLETAVAEQETAAKPSKKPEPKAIPKTPAKAKVAYLPLRDDGKQIQTLKSKPSKPDMIVKKAQLQPLEQARNMLAQGRLTEAEAQLKDMLTNNPADINARELLTGLLLRNQRLDEANDYIQGGLKIYPYNENLVLMQAKILLQDQQLDQAISLLKQQLQANRAGSKTLTMLAPLYQQKANYTASASIYRQLVRNMPGQAANWVGLGISLEALAQKQEAVSAYGQALQNNNLAESLKQYSRQRLKLLTQQGDINE